MTIAGGPDAGFENFNPNDGKQPFEDDNGQSYDALDTQPFMYEFPPEKARHPRTRLAIAGGILGAVSLGGGIFLLGQGEKEDSLKSSPVANESEKPVAAPISKPSPKPSPITPTSINTLAPAPIETESDLDPDSIGNYVEYDASAEKIDPYVIQMLYTNIEKAINTNNMDVLIYSGILPNSEKATYVQEVADYYYPIMQQNNDVGSFRFRLEERNILITYGPKIRITVQLARTTDYLNSIDAILYEREEFDLEQRKVTLPTGETKTIYAMGDITDTRIDREQWNQGLQKS